MRPWIAAGQPLGVSDAVMAGARSPAVRPARASLRHAARARTHPAYPQPQLWRPRSVGLHRHSPPSAARRPSPSAANASSPSAGSLLPLRSTWPLPLSFGCESGGATLLDY